MNPPVVMLVAAEASGDVLGAGLAKALKRRIPDVRFVGVGGPKMAAEGVQSAFDISALSIIGLIEGLMAYGRVRRRVAEVVALAERERPDIAVLIDSFGFTVRVGAALRKAGFRIPLIKYVGPQVWASRPGRARTLAQVFDHLLAILPFDAPFYEPFHLPVTFVGNPALATDFAGADGARFRNSIGAGPDEPILMVLPGSRPSEIQRMGPPFEDALRRLREERPELRVVVPIADTVADSVRTLVAGWPHVHLVGGEGPKRDAMRAATVAMACSGTVTTELAMAGTPMVVGYRLGGLTYQILKRIIRTRWVTLINIVAGKAIAPELLQDECTGENLAREVARRLDDPALRAAQVEEQNAALELLGRGMPDPSARAAEVVAQALKAGQPAQETG